MTTFRRIALVILTAVAAVIAGTQLRALVDAFNAPPSPPASILQRDAGGSGLTTVDA